MIGEFDGKVAFVTGAAGGIGQASALAFAARGAAVVVCDLLDPADTARRSNARAARPWRCSSTSRTAPRCRAAVDAAVSTFGRLDFAHNNAGTFAVARSPISPRADWHRVIAVNLTGVFLGMKYQIPHLLETGGAIVNTASIWSVQGAAVAGRLRRQQARRRRPHQDRSDRLRRAGDPVNAVAPGPIGPP